MKKWNLVAVAALTVFSATLCQADSLVITYRSGKTQTVILDEPSTTINSWQFVGGSTATTTPAPQQQAIVPQTAPLDAAKPANTKSDVKPAENKSGIRVKWNAPPIKD
ncbi:MAG: hypothetical protein PHN92_04850 [Geobacter sp.]|nr:hypothetical protein [Geobacter sp.]